MELIIMYIINGKEVENLQITTNTKGDTIVTYTEKYDIHTSHISETIKKLRKHHIKAQITKYPKYNLTIILAYHEKDIPLIIQLLKLNKYFYEINKELITISELK